MQFFPYFNLLRRPGTKGVVDDRGEVLFRHITVATALQYWKRGAAYLELTQQGARHYFGDTTSDERLQLLPLCKNANEVNAVLSLPKPSKVLKQAAQERMALWAVPQASSGEAGADQPQG